MFIRPAPDATDPERLGLVGGLEDAVGVPLSHDEIERDLGAVRAEGPDEQRDAVQMERLGEPLAQNSLPDVLVLQLLEQVSHGPRRAEWTGEATSR